MIVAKTERALPLSHILSPFYTQYNRGKARHPQCLAFLYPIFLFNYGQIALAAFASTTRLTAIR